MVVTIRTPRVHSKALRRSPTDTHVINEPHQLGEVLWYLETRWLMHRTRVASSTLHIRFQDKQTESTRKARNASLLDPLCEIYAPPRFELSLFSVSRCDAQSCRILSFFRSTAEPAFFFLGSLFGEG